MWTTLAEARSDLRNLIADSDTDKFSYRKKCFGTPNGTNVTFKTFERRRVTDFTTATAPTGVYVNGAPVASATDDTPTGEFSLTLAPADGDTVEATYYYQWFIDSELDQFLINATQWLGLGTNALNIPDGLIPAALHYAGQEGYHRLSNWWSVSIGETYRVEDYPKDSSGNPVQAYIALADAFKIKASELRDTYYTRQGQSLQPLFGTAVGRVRDYTPKR